MKNAAMKNAFIVLVTAAVLLVACAVSVIVVDPFFHYHAPLKGFPYVVDNQLSQNPGMAQHFSYDAVIVGSSMTVNFDTDDFEELLKLRTVKLSYSGAYPKDIANSLEIVYEAKEETGEALSAVFFPIDLPTYTGGIDEVKYPRPEYLYDKNPFNDVRYLWNKDVLLQYVIRPAINNKPTDLSMVYASWWTEEYYDAARVLAEHERPAEVESGGPFDNSGPFDKLRDRNTELRDREEVDVAPLIEGAVANLDANILPFIEAHPETTFYCFYPPYSILYWSDLRDEGRTEAVLAQTEYVAERLLQYENVRLFFFQDMEKVVTDLNRYADYSHYHPSVNRMMVESFADGTHEVTRDGVPRMLEKMRGILYSYDFEGLFAEE